MKMQSMTGFARSSGQNSQLQWSWELRSVNGKGLDMRLRIPNGWERLDPVVRAEVSKHFKRGSISASLDIKMLPGAQKLAVNTELLDQLIELCQSKGSEPNLDQLLAIRGVLEHSEDRSEFANDESNVNDIISSLKEALKGLLTQRQEEGLQTQKVLLEHLGEIGELVEKAATCAGGQPASIRAKIERQIAELLVKNEEIDPQRLAQEVSILTIKADIREELDRLKAHVQAGGELLSQGGVIGRKLDFLCQEFNREANTLCSKSSDIDLTQLGLELKAVIDQIREQAANVE
ncbi:MAG: YicC/YloC family endoribonuclease [Alphaproteobacteria bacterium]|nr:YicC/YloC family endoribonuclease [Alphaproteobacteria bacterium]